MLLQIDVDAAEKHSPLARARLVGAQRRVGGNQQDVGPLAVQFGRQGVVVKAGAAEPAGRAGRDVGNFHGAAFTWIADSRIEGLYHSRITQLSQRLSGSAAKAWPNSPSWRALSHASIASAFGRLSLFENK